MSCRSFFAQQLAEHRAIIGIRVGQLSDCRCERIPVRPFDGLQEELGYEERPDRNSQDLGDGNDSRHGEADQSSVTPDAARLKLVDHALRDSCGFGELTLREVELVASVCDVCAEDVGNF